MANQARADTAARARQAIQQGHQDIAKIYAQNAIRKQNERLNLLRLGSRIDAVASRVQTAVTMRQVTGSMMNVVKGMDQAMKAMDLEKVRTFPQFLHLNIFGDGKLTGMWKRNRSRQ
jgi:division protein CdvB (Snf7/Vps24/ESCRT-III family)